MREILLVITAVVMFGLPVVGLLWECLHSGKDGP